MKLPIPHTAKVKLHILLPILAGLLLMGPVTSYSQSSEVLLFSKTDGYRHDIIEYGREVIEDLAEQGDFAITTSENAGLFNDQPLSSFDVIIFMNTSGEVLNDQQKTAFQEYIRNGGGFVAIHQGITTHQNWDWYIEMVGGLKFKDHPEVQPGVLRIENQSHPSTTHLPDSWKLTDEFYSFTANPRDVTNVLMTLDESTYEGGTMGEDHPYAWFHEFEGGRIFCTGLGHTEEVFDNKNYQQHLIGGIRWAAGLED